MESVKGRRNMNKMNNQTGTSKIGILIITIMIIIIAYGALKYFPMQLHSTDFYDRMERIARDPGYRDKDSIVNELMKKARELDLPINQNQIKIDLTKGNVEITVDYQVVISTPFRDFVFDYHPHVSERRIY